MPTSGLLKLLEDSNINLIDISVEGVPKQQTTVRKLIRRN